VPGNKAIVKLLITHGTLDAHVKPSDDLARQFLAVFLAAEARVRAMMKLHPELVRLPDGRSDHPIHHAARNGDTAIVRALIEHGADVHARGHDGNTTLYCAAGHGHLDTTRALLDAGADPDLPFTEDGKDLRAWLQQYPQDPRFKRIVAYLEQR